MRTAMKISLRPSFQLVSRQKWDQGGPGQARHRGLNGTDFTVCIRIMTSSRPRNVSEPVIVSMCGKQARLRVVNDPANNVILIVPQSAMFFGDTLDAYG